MALDENRLSRATAVGRSLANGEPNPWAAGLAPRLRDAEVEKLLLDKPTHPEPLGGLAHDVASFFKWTLLTSFSGAAWLLLLVASLAGEPVGVVAYLILALISVWLIRRTILRSRERLLIRAEWDRWRHRTSEERLALRRALDTAYTARLHQRRDME